MKSITFATLLIPPFWERETLLLAESLRTFGGAMAEQPLVVLYLPDKPPPSKIANRLHALGAVLAPFKLDADAVQFPLAIVPFGAATAEQYLTKQSEPTDLLAWMLPDTLILTPPLDLDLPEAKKLGYRPVHHQNVGSEYAQPPDAFWQQIYAHCEVPPAHLFRMETCYREVVRPYINAGLLVCRPQDGFMQTWLDVFRRTYQHPDFTPFYEQYKYAVFMHQAVLSGVMLNKYTPGQLAELPESYNYPLHMHADYPEASRIHHLGELHTARFENNQDLKNVLPKFDSDPQKIWIENFTGER